MREQAVQTIVPIPGWIKTLNELFDALVMGQGQFTVGGKSYNCHPKLLTDARKLVNMEAFKFRMRTIQKQESLLHESGSKKNIHSLSKSLDVNTSSPKNKRQSQSGGAVFESHSSYELAEEAEPPVAISPRSQLLPITDTKMMLSSGNKEQMRYDRNKNRQFSKLPKIVVIDEFSEEVKRAKNNSKTQSSCRLAKTQARKVISKSIDVIKESLSYTRS